MPNEGNNTRSRANNRKKNGTTQGPRKTAVKAKKKTKAKKTGMPLWKKIFFGVLALGIIGLASGAGLFFYYVSSAPELTEEKLVGTVASTILDAEGNEIKEIGGNDQNRTLITAEEIPQVLKDAIVSIEDQRFYDHNGVDPIRIIGALFANLQQGGISQGGSTITQQLIKLSYFSTSSEDQTLERKAQEAWMSMQLEREYTKDEILAFYINKVYMSNNVYGMGTAAEYFFGKPITDVTLAEAATLAGMPQAPSLYDPISNAPDTQARRDLVLDMMVENEKITTEESAEAKTVQIKGSIIDHSGDVNTSLVIDPYIQLVIAEVAEKTGLDVYEGGLTITTNIDMDAQQHLYDIVNTYDYIEFPDDLLQTGVSMVDVNTGAIQAVSGGRNQNVQLGLNRASTLERSIGSTMKPMSVYGPAIEYLDYSTGTLVVDEEYSYSDGSEINNYDNEYNGDQTIREALVDSRNIPALKTFQEVGADNAFSFLQKLGITITNDDQEYLVESNAIGGVATPIQLSAAYAAFANGGTYYEPYTVQSVTTAEGEEFTFEPNGTEAMKESTAYMITDMLKDVITEGTATNAQISGLPQAGKTGTTNYTDDELAAVGGTNVPYAAPDAWFAGYSTSYSISVWVGYDRPQDYGNFLDYQTQSLTRDIYRELMSYVSEDTDYSDWTLPSSVSQVSIEKYTDPILKPGPNTPSSLIATELFVKGTEPTSTSKKYGVTLLAPSGLKASYNKDKDELTVEWDKYSASGTDSNAQAQYTVTAGGASETTTATKVVIDKPDKGTITISLLVKVGSSTSPASTIQLTISDPAQESSEADSEDDSANDSSSSSSSSAESDQASSAAQDDEEANQNP
ncbi:PBP1A family penicillin-binding protein [Trichococcus shcherbakoviae]|uniref:PBP1A family penicillin-binding protein n=1 Tax=Trichococcus shcherbakoviae subsp. psychrophilus TaxID=2585775 RepID=A0A5C5E7I2_9LACT|nr:PBP1A family penicillin-binding protein [Trichococcus shcherbakoviae]TNV69139.1 PBP1A family penicillin-binding protein [Trichococcus shcherbakoviae subsp. psychrophilus]